MHISRAQVEPEEELAMPTLHALIFTKIPTKKYQEHAGSHLLARAACSSVVAFLLLGVGMLSAHAEKISNDSLQEPYHFTLQTSVATRHFRPNSTQNNHQDLLNLEWNYDSNLLVGAATFRNSFKQSTQLVYWGAKFHPIASAPGAYVKVVGGLLHGYRGEYKDKIPFNKYGTAPVILPAAGYCYKQVCSELIVFGAGAMLTAGARF